jgi:hypothetical protein
MRTREHRKDGYDHDEQNGGHDAHARRCEERSLACELTKPVRYVTSAGQQRRGNQEPHHQHYAQAEYGGQGGDEN